MSVSFYAAINIDDTTPRMFRLTCEAQGVLGEWTGYGNAYSEANAHSLVCTDYLCQGYGARVDEITDDPEALNYNNRNAMRVLRTLGYITDADVATDEAAHGDGPTFAGIRHTEIELCGGDAAENFLGRVLVALAISPADEGMPTARQGNVIDCGWAAGDMQERLEALRALAEACVALGREVAWA